MISSALLVIICNILISPAISSTSSSLFGIRGGGFFGNRFGRSKSNSSGGGDDDDGKPKRFKALTREEIEEKLNIPIYGLTDASGNGVILSGDNGSNIFHFFFNKHMAGEFDITYRLSCSRAVHNLCCTYSQLQLISNFLYMYSLRRGIEVSEQCQQRGTAIESICFSFG